MMDPSSHPYGQPAVAPPRYVMLSDAHTNSLQPPPGRRNLPRYYSRRNHHSSGSCCGCLCWCCCFLLVALVALVALLVYAYVSLDPKPPNYRVDNLTVGAFDARPDFSLHTEFVVTVRAENPNRHIGVTYGKDSMVAVTYEGAVLCSGKLPAFHQGPMNTTVMKVVLSGDSAFGSGLQKALTESEEKGDVPLEIYVKVPVVLRAWETDSSEVTVLVNCHLVVDSLKPNKKVGIKKAEYKVNVKF